MMADDKTQTFLTRAGSARYYYHRLDALCADLGSYYREPGLRLEYPMLPGHKPWPEHVPYLGESAAGHYLRRGVDPGYYYEFNGLGVNVDQHFLGQSEHIPLPMAPGEGPWDGHLSYLEEANEKRDEAKGEVVALNEVIAAPYAKCWSIVTWCPECGLFPKFDEDSCCEECGATVGDIPDFRALEAEVERLCQQRDEARAEVEEWKSPVIAERTALAVRLEAERDEALAEVEGLETSLDWTRKELQRLVGLLAMGCECTTPGRVLSCNGCGTVRELPSVNDVERALTPAPVEGNDHAD